MKIHFNHTVRLFTACLLLLSCAAGSLLAQNNNMGVGTTSPDASAILDVKSTTKGLLIPRMEPLIFPATTATSTGLLIYNKGDKVLNYWDGSWRPVGLWKLNTTGEKAYYSAGFVGIGTTDPLSKLSISPSTAEAKITLWDNGSTTTHHGFGVSAGQTNYDVPPNNDHVFFAGGKNGTGTELMRIKGTGNVGIGTSNPQQKLSVIGLVRGAVDVAETEYTEMGHGGSNGYINTVGDGNLDFRHNSSTLMSLTETGNVGIGDSSPDYKLTIGGGNEVIALDNTATMVAKNSSGTYQAFLWPRWSDNVMYMNYGTAGFNIRNNSSTSTMFMTNSGDVGIGISPSGGKLHLYHGGVGLKIQHSSAPSDFWEIYHSPSDNRLELWNNYNGIYDNRGYFDYNDGGYHGVSDSRLKENINPLHAVLPSLMQLQAKTYIMKGDLRKEEKIGFMAQELEKFFPQLVTPPSTSEKGETPYFVNYAGFGILAIKAIQEQQTVIEAQAAKIESQQAEIDAIKKALAKAGIKLD